MSVHQLLTPAVCRGAEKRLLIAAVPARINFTYQLTLAMGASSKRLAGF